MVSLLALMTWVPVSVAGAQGGARGSAPPGAIVVQATPTEDATVTELNKQKLEQEVQQLKEQNEPDLFGWLRTNAPILFSTLVVVIGGLIGLFRWFGDRRSEREKRAEERFQSVVTGLGDEKEGAKIGAAILLRTFLRPDYKQFYTQSFDLAVAHLRLPRTPHPPEDPNAALSLTTLSQALIGVFKEAFPRARRLTRNGRRGSKEGAVQSLDATAVLLDHAYLVGADLERMWMLQASLREANLREARLGEADLHGADLRGANLRKADLRKAILINAKLGRARLEGAKLGGADLHGADLCGADLNRSDLSGATLWEAELRGAGLHGAKFSGTDLHEADLSEADLGETDLEDALSLKDTNLRGVKGLTKEQLEACQAKGAIV